MLCGPKSNGSVRTVTVHIGHSCRLGERGLGRELGDGADHEVVE